MCLHKSEFYPLFFIGRMPMSERKRSVSEPHCGKFLKLFKKVLTNRCKYSIIYLVVRKYDLCASGSAVEHLLAKEGVAGSIPVSRSENKNGTKVLFLFFFRALPGLEVQSSPFHFGPRKAKVHRTLCAVPRFYYFRKS